MSWWQKKLLRYALSQTGLLDDKAIDFNNLDITFGHRNVIELRDVGLNIQRISKLAQLPPSLRVETARVLLLKLTVPADIYQSSIEAEVEGVELSLRLEESVPDEGAKRKSRTRSPVVARTPQHRKVHQRLQSPPPFHPGGLSDPDDELHIPTTQELAKSFLMEEPVQERRELEAFIGAKGNQLDESVVSEGSEGAELGVGAGIGLPGFLAGFLQGVLDRLEVRISDVNVKVETEIAGDVAEAIPVTLRLKVGNAELASLADDHNATSRSEKRHVKLESVTIDLLSDASIFSELSEVPSRASPALSRAPTNISSPGDGPATPQRPSTTSAYRSFESADQVGHDHTSPPTTMQASIASRDTVPFADAQDETPHSASSQADLDIRAGDDNISWGSRRSRQTDAPAQDLWNSMASEDDLPDSLLLERAATPRRGSPTATRTRRPVSPYDRSLQSPGSWPRLEESPERRRVPQSPGSWPLMDQAQQSMYQPLTPRIVPSESDLMDNKRSALVFNDVTSDELPSPPEPKEAQLEDLTQSRMYSHEEAESMYMSAMTQSPKIAVPGGWGSEESQSDASPSPKASQPSPGNISAPQVDGAMEGRLASGVSVQPTSGNVTPRAQSPELTRSKFDTANQKGRLVSRQLVMIDTVSLMLPSAQSHCDDEEDGSRQAQADFKQEHHAMPGTFSAYSHLSASHRRPALSSDDPGQSVLWASSDKTECEDAHPNFEASLGKISCRVDLACCRLLNKLNSLAMLLLQPSDSAPPGAANNEPSRIQQREVAVKIRQLQLSLSEKWHQESPTVALNVQDAALKIGDGEFDGQLGQLSILLGGSDLLSFSQHGTLSSSKSVPASPPDVFFKMNFNKQTAQKRPITEMRVETMPVVVQVDLGIIDETLGSFGGLSGVLELSNSFLSDGHSPSSPVTPKASKGVRFQGDVDVSKMGPELKVNIRLDGADLSLRGEACSLTLRASTVKAVYRETTSSVRVERISLSGPFRTSQDLAPILIDLTSVQLDFLPSPHDKDLERLLSLLTPSKDKYDNDDDILIDTLLRQRRKGGVVRASVNDVKVKIAEYECFDVLSALANDMTKLSVVTKYLPEDDRPGILSFVRVSTIAVQLPVNQQFGTITLGCEEFHLAHVGLPALIALSIESVKATQTDSGLEIVHALVALPRSERLPMVMARMLGDEVEPTAKVKLYNLCIEYSVPILLDLAGMGNMADPDELVAELAKSVADLSLPRHRKSGLNSVPSAPAVKRTNVNLLVHDSAIGLNPQKIPSKALLVLTDARLSALVPPEDTLTASLELRKAAIYITDEAGQEINEHSRGRELVNSTATSARLGEELSHQGYISVGSILKAHVRVQVKGDEHDRSNHVDVDVNNELLLLETCADSTHTLMATLSALAPPSPPSKQQKYLTEPMTVEDMMASFTGDPFDKSETAPETLFDVAEEPLEDPDLLLNGPALDQVDDELFMESEMTSSLYGPVSGMLEGVDKPDDDETADADFPETAESLLEEDPFEMPSSPTDIRLSDAALARDLGKQCKPAVAGGPVGIDLYEIEDLGLDALGPDSQILGTQFRFNTPAAQRRKLPLANKDRSLPFRLRLRDIHIIWNIYDGYDWQRTRDGITQAVEQVETQAEERKARRRQSLNDREDDESVIGDFLFNSIYIGVPAHHDAQELRRQINHHIDDLASETESVPLSGMSRPTTHSASGRPIRSKPRRRLKLGRSKAHKVAFELKGVSADVLMFPAESKEVVSSLDIRIRDFEIFDNVPTSTWRKFLTHLNNDATAREMAKPMIHAELLNVRTLEQYAASELILHVSVLPLRLHVDQDALDFITRFFGFKDERMAEPSTASEQPFLQRVEVDTVDLQLDYKPKHVDYAGIRSGHTTEFMNFITLDAANIRLKHAIVYGIRGFEPLHKTLNDIWMPDVQRHQLPTVLAGLAPVRSLVNIGSGVRDVIAIPIREYQKDGRIVRSIQKGAFLFGKTTASELARLGAKVAIGTQNILSGAEGYLSPASASPSNRSSVGRRVSSEQGWQDVDDQDTDHEQRAISAYANQPLGLLSGLRSARKYLEHDLLTAKDALIAVQGEVLESRTAGAAAAAVVRHAPTVILRPVIGASRAVGTTLLGVGNQIDSGNVRRVEDVSRPPSDINGNNADKMLAEIQETLTASSEVVLVRSRTSTVAWWWPCVTAHERSNGKAMRMRWSISSVIVGTLCMFRLMSWCFTRLQ